MPIASEGFGVRSTLLTKSENGTLFLLGVNLIMSVKSIFGVCNLGDIEGMINGIITSKREGRIVSTIH